MHTRNDIMDRRHRHSPTLGTASNGRGIRGTPRERNPARGERIALVGLSANPCPKTHTAPDAVEATNQAHVVMTVAWRTRRGGASATRTGLPAPGRYGPWGQRRDAGFSGSDSIRVTPGANRRPMPMPMPWVSEKPCALSRKTSAIKGCWVMPSRERKASRKTGFRRRLAAGMSVRCNHCGATEQVNVNDYHAGRARCSTCGGAVERVHAAGK